MIDTLFNILPFALLVPLFGWLIISPIAYVWFFLDIEKAEQFKERHENITGAIIIGATLSLFIVLLLGIERFLVFIPREWGRYEYGEFTSIRVYISGVLALSFSYFFIHIIYELDNMRSENRRLSKHRQSRIVKEIQKRKDELLYCSRDLLLKKQEETQDQLQRLEEIDDERRLSDDEEMDIKALYELLEEIEYRIQKTESNLKSSLSINKHEKINPAIKETKDEPLQTTENVSKLSIDKENLSESKRKTQLEDMYTQLELHDLENMRLMGNNEGKDT
jgi:hypothetical protein